MTDTDITCQQFLRDLADYLAGEMSVDDSRRSELHLAVCPQCVSYLKNYEVTIRLGSDSAADADDALPEGLANVILTARRRAT